jgi:hypothetical protein
MTEQQELDLAERIADSTHGHNRDGKSPTDLLRDAVEADRKEQARKKDVMDEIELRVNTFILKLLAQRAAQKAARKAPAPASKVKVAARPADLHAHYAQLRSEGYSAMDAAIICGRYLKR